MLGRVVEMELWEEARGGWLRVQVCVRMYVGVGGGASGVFDHRACVCQPPCMHSVPQKFADQAVWVTY